MTRHTRVLAVVLLLSIAPGCNDEYPESLEYQFQPYHTLSASNERETLDVDPALAQEIAGALKDYFGTPRIPTVKLSEDLKNNPELKLDDHRLSRGSHYYRRYCLYCHGINGDGNGPTGRFLLPRPRDFRLGIFKFRTNQQGTTPTRMDLKHTLVNGIPGSSMPSFGILSDDDLEYLVSYVIHLSLRGIVERQYVLAKRAGEEADIGELLEAAARTWIGNSATVVNAPEPPGGWYKFYQEGVLSDWQRGRELYTTKGACVECHGRDGRASAIELPTNVNRRDAWGELIVPRDLTHGVYRGGSRPVDIFYRIKVGIPGTGMPGAALSDEEIWHVVGYVMSMPLRR